MHDFIIGNFVEKRTHLAKMLRFNSTIAIFWLFFTFIVPHETPRNRGNFSCLAVKFFIKCALEYTYLIPLNQTSV